MDLDRDMGIGGAFWSGNSADWPTHSPSAHDSQHMSQPCRRAGGRWPPSRGVLWRLGLGIAMLGLTVVAVLVLAPQTWAWSAPWGLRLLYAGLDRWLQLLGLVGVLCLPLIMAYRPEVKGTYVFHKDIEETAAAFLHRLTPDDARHYVAIVGAGPAGLRTAELLVALNRQVSAAEQRKILLFDRNPVPAGLGAYGIPPVKKQGVLKDGIVQQAQGVMHGMAGKREWGAFPRDKFLQVIDSALVRFFPHTDVGTDITIEQLEQLGIPLVIATGAQQPRFPTDVQGAAVRGGDLPGIISATSEFFRQIGMVWLQNNKGVQGLSYDRKPHTLHGTKTIMVYGGGNVASDAFMWAFRNTPPGTDVLLVYRGELHAMTNMSRPYYKPIDEALRQRRAASPLVTVEDVLDATAFQARIVSRQDVVDKLVLHRLPDALQKGHAVPAQAFVQALNAVLQMPDLAHHLPDVEVGSLRVDLHPIWAQVMQNGVSPLGHEPEPWLFLHRALLEMAYPNELRRLHRANMFGLLTVEAYLDRSGQGSVTHVLLRQHRRGALRRDRKTGLPMLLRSGVIERDNIMRHRVTKEKLYRWGTEPSETFVELAVDLVIEAIGDVVQPLGQLEMTSWQTFKADLDTGRVAGRMLWIAGQALTQKGKVRDSYVSAGNTVMDMGPMLYPQAWNRQQLWRILMPGFDASATV